MFLQVFESRAELIELGMSVFYVKNEVGASMVNLATRKTKSVAYLVTFSVVQPAVQMSGMYKNISQYALRKFRSVHFHTS